MVEILSRIQFAFTVSFHFLFVPLSIGLIALVVLYEFRYTKTKNKAFKELSYFYGDLFVINYAFGIVTGITMSLQFGTNWSAYSIFMGDVFGTPLVFEALMAFFLESTFTGLWIFKKDKMSDKMRKFTAVMILVGTSISALWIITANAFMQHPVGFELASDGSKVLISNFFEVLTNPYMFYTLIHTVISAVLLGAYFVLAVGGYKMHHSHNDKEKEAFKVGLKPAVILLLITSLLMPLLGSPYFNYVSKVQPIKAEAIAGSNPYVQLAFIVMIMLGTFFILYSAYILIFYKKFLNSPFMQKTFMKTLAFPYIAITAGWMVTEVGRQPYVVYELMMTSKAISNVSAGQVWFSIITIFIMYAILFVACYYLLKQRILQPLVKIKDGE